MSPPPIDARQLTGDEIREVFRKIANGERLHGTFLRKFAELYMLASPRDEQAMRSAAVLLIAQYGLAAYAMPAEARRT